MENLNQFIKESGVTLLCGVYGIGTEVIYQNLMLDCYKDMEVLVILNDTVPEKVRRRFNRMLYADFDGDSEFCNFHIEEAPKDMKELERMLQQYRDVKLIVADRLPLLGMDSREALSLLKKHNESTGIPTLVISLLDKEKLGAREDSHPAYQDAEECGLLDLVGGVLTVYRKSFYYGYRKSPHTIEVTAYKNKESEPIHFEFKYNHGYKKILYETSSQKNVREEAPKGFDNIAGYDEIKKELLLIKSWWDNKKEIENQGIDIPHGLLLFGPIGTGKSMFAREFVNLFPDITVVKVDGSHDWGSDEITEKFEYARSLNKPAIILIDEFDYVAERDERELLTQLDGLGGDNSNIFVIATCNDFESLNPALTRRGRLDYIIGIGNPNDRERISLLKFYFEKYGIHGDFDYEYLSIITKGENAVNIKGIANETRLRYGTTPTLSEVEEMIDKINKRNLNYYGDNEDKNPFMTALHEAGHAVVSWYHKDLFTFYKATLEDNSLAGGLCKIFPTGEAPGSMDRALADIEIAMGGYLACMMLYNYRDQGAASDLERARRLSASLVNTYGYSGFGPLLCHSQNAIPTSPFKKYKNEKKSERILRSCERNVRRIFRKNKENLITLANRIVEKKTITKKDLTEVLGA